MFYLEGWVPLIDVAAEVGRRLEMETLAAIRGSQGDTDWDLLKNKIDWDLLRDLTDRKANVETWEICANAKAVAVLLSNGQVALASKLLVWCEDVSQNSNGHVDLNVGTVGSTDWRREAPDVVMVGFLPPAVEYGPFLGLPVLLDESCMSRAQHGPRPEEEAAENSPPVGRSEATLAKDIVALWDQGARLPKPAVKALLAPEMGAKAFERSWARARESRRDLGKAGRKPRRT